MLQLENSKYRKSNLYLPLERALLSGRILKRAKCHFLYLIVHDESFLLFL